MNDQDLEGTIIEDSSEESKDLVMNPEDVRLRRLMRERLQTTSIPKLELEDIDGNLTKFADYYEFIRFLGCGSFGFVV